MVFIFTADGIRILMVVMQHSGLIAVSNIT